MKILRLSIGKKRRWYCVKRVAFSSLYSFLYIYMLFSLSFAQESSLHPTAHRCVKLFKFILCVTHVFHNVTVWLFSLLVLVQVVLLFTILQLLQSKTLLESGKKANKQEKDNNSNIIVK
ncbi:hypothetical protein, unlikely [Trypanosoma brucei brucei TREU927]|uniref:Uncharacterized protein n=1 Tax=Trypanosoma brucei brucei (strain 927/4 GUTat10.1) TaxID=185431 RepID=Q38FR3_TRYB2|nr:hypothetical protein, unlikely [Trypanosoma brucei brucei TREU927]EAN76357.1 hypothetical protein, unlikely [Trypanosoma brucei brucei TREU927]